MYDKILSSELVKDTSNKPGEIIHIGKKGFVVATPEKGLLVKKVHLESSKPMDAFQFANGHKLEVGITLGDK